MGTFISLYSKFSQETVYQILLESPKFYTKSILVSYFLDTLYMYI